MRQSGDVGGVSGGGVFERLVRDAQGASDLAAFRSSMLAALGDLIGADSGSLMDPIGAVASAGVRSRTGSLHIGPEVVRLYASNRARYDHSGQRLLHAMECGPVVDSQIYRKSERERLDIYAEVLLPQGTRSMLCASVRHRGRAISRVFLKRHGRGLSFRERDADVLARLLSALALADAGFQHSAAGSWMDVAPALHTETRPLGTRETEVALLVCKGMRNREIALLLGTSCETVKKQIRNVFDKIGVSNRAELAGLMAGQRPS